MLTRSDPETYTSLEALGICTIDAGGETNVADLAGFYRDLGKRTFALCDKQSDDRKESIEAQVETLLMHNEKGFEDLVLKNTTEEALGRFSRLINWPQDLLTKFPDPENQAVEALGDYFKRKKAEWSIADFLAQCDESEVPEWLRTACISLKNGCSPKLATNIVAGEHSAETTKTQLSGDETN